MNLYTQHFHGVPGIELKSLCSGGKHFTDWPTSVALQVPLLDRIRIPMGGGLMSVCKFSRWKNKMFSHLVCCSLGGVFPWWRVSLVVCFLGSVSLVVCSLGSVFPW